MKLSSSAWPVNLRSLLPSLSVMSLSSVPSICAGLKPLQKSITLARRPLSSARLVSVFGRFGISTPASALQQRAAWVDACCTCRTYGYMSGANRMLRKKLGSSCLASIAACNLSMQFDWAVRNCTKIGTEHLYMEMGIWNASFLDDLPIGVSGGAGP